MAVFLNTIFGIRIYTKNVNLLCLLFWYLFVTASNVMQCTTDIRWIKEILVIKEKRILIDFFSLKYFTLYTAPVKEAQPLPPCIYIIQYVSYMQDRGAE